MQIAIGKHDDLSSIDNIPLTVPPFDLNLKFAGDANFDRSVDRLFVIHFPRNVGRIIRFDPNRVRRTEGPTLFAPAPKAGATARRGTTAAVSRADHPHPDPAGAE